MEVGAAARGGEGRTNVWSRRGEGRWIRPEMGAAVTGAFEGRGGSSGR